jgi:tRNA pseudouridine synthase 10
LNIKEKAIEILKEGFVCDRCLGRNFAQLLSGMSNEERGKIIRNYLAMLADSGEEFDINDSNFYGIKFHTKRLEPKRPKKCFVCFDLFPELKKKTKLIVNELKKYEHKTFLVGCKLTSGLIGKEQEIWGRVGIEWCESIKSEINRELGKEISKLTGKDMDRKLPDIVITFNLNDDDVDLDVRSIYVYGKYQKLVRGIPQTKWKKKVFPTSIQEIIEKPFLKQTKSEESSFHGSGREDVDVRCLGWRPFVLELISPRKRKLKLKEVLGQVNKSKKVKVKNLKVVGKELVRKIKFADYDKTYRAIVEFENPVEDLKKVNELKGMIISQKTPTRVLRRRSDKIRRRGIIDVRFKILGEKKVDFQIKTRAGVYVKELINGDEGRTEPSISGLLGNKVKKIDLDVVKIWTHND